MQDKNHDFNNDATVIPKYHKLIEIAEYMNCYSMFAVVFPCW